MPILPNRVHRARLSSLAKHDAAHCSKDSNHTGHWTRHTARCCC